MADRLDTALQTRLARLADDGAPALDDAARRRVLEAVRAEAPEVRREAGLAALAERGGPSLDEAARARVLAVVRGDAAPAEVPAEAPLDGVVEAPAAAAGDRPARPRRRRWAAGFAAALGVAAAASALAWVGASDGPSGGSSADGARACEAWAPADEGLGRRGEMTTVGELTVSAPDGCTTELSLLDGRVDVHARDLGGGVLRVRAGAAQVEVRGTRFSVSREGGAVAVAVREGHVVVSNGDEPEVHLRGGDRWERGGPVATAQPPALDDPRLASAEPASAEPASAEPTSAQPGARTLVDGPAPPVAGEPAPRPVGVAGAERGPVAGRSAPSAPEPGATLREAERRWRAGERDRARALFRQVGLGEDTLAEAAWVRLARHELQAGSPARARQAARSHRRRFPRGRLGAEALWILAQSARRLGDAGGADRAVDELRARYPDSPQARAAERAE